MKNLNDKSLALKHHSLSLKKKKIANFLKARVNLSKDINYKTVNSVILIKRNTECLVRLQRSPDWRKTLGH